MREKTAQKSRRQGATGCSSCGVEHQRRPAERKVHLGPAERMHHAQIRRVRHRHRPHQADNAPEATLPLVTNSPAPSGLAPATAADVRTSHVLYIGQTPPARSARQSGLDRSRG
ncbi:hypothetical protein SBRY_10984 [Actinacidiphila bryophytorum]|uniref:Uncharacterized protein n=1 Tax=Actinacidiphila bryophytorum TaxID=1436133 RepID=A0A9W4E008_9ACTN|nr:hypothetical protein SBRY_10984 [Actinacidiphila bryophytorum]